MKSITQSSYKSGQGFNEITFHNVGMRGQKRMVGSAYIPNASSDCLYWEIIDKKAAVQTAVSQHCVWINDLYCRTVILPGPLELNTNEEVRCLVYHNGASTIHVTLFVE